MGVFNFGSVADALAGRKTKKMYASDPLQEQIDKSIGGVDAYRSDISRGLGEFETGMRENIAKQKSYEPIAEQELSAVQNEVLGGDFLADRERIRGGDLNSLAALLGQIGGGMSAADKVASARLGYAGRPSGTYQDKNRQAYMGAFASPLANTIFAGLNTGASGADAARRGKAGTVAGIIEERSKIPDRATDRMLAVPSARADFFNKEIGALGGLSDVNKSNFLGLKEEKNKWASALGAMDESLNSTLDTAMSIYGLGGFGGFMGGGAGAGAIGGEAKGGTGDSGQSWIGKVLQTRPGYQYQPPSPYQAPYPYAPPPVYQAPIYYRPPPYGTPPYVPSGGGGVGVGLGNIGLSYDLG